jgi:hypothetical protein
MATFDECGIHFLSASSVGNFTTNPAWWVVRYLRGVKPMPSPSLARATAIKAGVVAWMNGVSESRAEDVALERFNLEASEVAAPFVPGWALKAQKEHDAILPMLNEIFKLFLEWGLRRKPIASGIFNTVMLDGISVPFVTSPDIVLEDCVIDINTTHKMPSSDLSKKDIQLSALHMIHRNIPALRAYATMKRSAIVPIAGEDAAAALEELRRNALALETFLDRTQSPESALEALPLKPDHFLWDGRSLEAARKLSPQLPPQEMPAWALPYQKPQISSAPQTEPISPCVTES